MIRLAGAALLLAALSADSLAAQGRPGQLYVGRVRFDGNKALDDVVLASSISTSSSSWIFRWFRKFGERQEFDEIEFRRDVVRLQLLYRQHGFYEAKVDTALDRGDRLIDPRFTITEGPPIVVDSVAVTGVDSVRGGPGLAGGLPLGRGDRFDRFVFDASGDSLAFAVRDRGYPFAIVFRNFTVNRLTRIATVQYDVLPGPYAHIGDIAVQGNQKISEPTVQRALTIRVGDEYRRTALLNSQRALYQSDLFRYASVGIATPDSVVGSGDSLVRVRVQVAESNPLQARAGIGYGTIDCLRASGTMTLLNFMGEARRLDFVTRVSKIGVGDPFDLGLKNSLCGELANDQFSDRINYLGSVTLSQPIGLVRGGVVSLQAFSERRSEFNVYLVGSAGGALSMKFGVGRNRGVPMTTTYRLSTERTTAGEAAFCVYFNQCNPSTIASFSAPRRQGSLSVSLVNQRVDSPIEPSRGQTFTLEFTTASPWLGSQIVFDRLVTEGVVYRPVGGRKVLSMRLRGGIIRPGVSSIGGIDQRYVPPSEAFYAGGPTTVRGFGRNEMGPVVYVYDSLATGQTNPYVGLRSSPIGSSALVLGNLEVRAPTPVFGGKLGIALFVDAAQLWASNGTGYAGGGFRVTPGLGFQISTPLGPMRLTTAYNGYGKTRGPLYRIDDSTNTLIREGDYAGDGPAKTVLGRLQWHFSVGMAF